MIKLPTANADTISSTVVYSPNDVISQQLKETESVARMTPDRPLSPQEKWESKYDLSVRESD